MTDKPDGIPERCDLCWRPIIYDRVHSAPDDEGNVTAYIVGWCPHCLIFYEPDSEE